MSTLAVSLETFRSSSKILTHIRRLSLPCASLPAAVSWTAGLQQRLQLLSCSGDPAVEIVVCGDAGVVQGKKRTIYGLNPNFQRSEPTVSDCVPRRRCGDTGPSHQSISWQKKGRPLIGAQGQPHNALGVTLVDSPHVILC